MGTLRFLVLEEEVGGSRFVFDEFAWAHPKRIVFATFALRFSFLLFGMDEGGVFRGWRFAALPPFVLRKIIDKVAVVVIYYRYVEVVY